MDEEKKKIKILPKLEGKVIEMPSADADALTPEKLLELTLKEKEEIELLVCVYVTKDGLTKVTHTDCNAYDLTYVAKALDIVASTHVYDSLETEDED